MNRLTWAIASVLAAILLTLAWRWATYQPDFPAERYGQDTGLDEWPMSRLSW